MVLLALLSMLSMLAGADADARVTGGADAFICGAAGGYTNLFLKGVAELVKNLINGTPFITQLFTLVSTDDDDDDDCDGDDGDAGDDGGDGIDDDCVDDDADDDGYGDDGGNDDGDDDAGADHSDGSC